jgi:hypothetical protein
MRPSITLSWWRVADVWFVILALLLAPGSASIVRASTYQGETAFVAEFDGDRTILMATQDDPVRVARPERSDERPAEPFALFLSRLPSTHQTEPVWASLRMVERHPRLFGGLVGVVELRI